MQYVTAYARRIYVLYEISLVSFFCPPLLLPCSLCPCPYRHQSVPATCSPLLLSSSSYLSRYRHQSVPATCSPLLRPFLLSSSSLLSFSSSDVPFSTLR